MPKALSIALLLLCTACANRGNLACRLVALHPDGSIVTHGPGKPAPWHAGEDQCMVKLRVMESLPDSIRQGIGVQYRGPEDQVKALQDRWNREHDAKLNEHRRKAI